MVSNRHVYQLVRPALLHLFWIVGYAACGLLYKENTEGREQGDEGLVILERTLKYQYLALCDWIWLILGVFLHMCESVGTVYSV